MNTGYSCRRRLIASVIFFSFILTAGCTSMKPDNLGIHHGRLAPCPSSPNCVSSDAQNDRHAVTPFRLRMEPNKAWRIIQETVASLPRTHIQTVTENYLHGKAKSQLFGFVDDLELHLRPDENLIAVRSASRIGYYDLGVNRKRVERLRQQLQSRGVIE